MKFTRTFARIRLFALAVLCMGTAAATAATKTSTGSGGVWSSAATWSPSSVPTAADDVVIAAGSPVTSTGSSASFVCASLTVSTGATLTVQRPMTVSGPTSISGTIHFGSNGSSPRLITLSGGVTLNGGAVWDETTSGAAATFSFGGNLVNHATTFTTQNTTHTFAGTGKTLGGTTSLPQATISGTYTNNGTLTVSTTLAGTGTLTQGESSTLNIGGTSAITTLVATASPNTVNYTGTAQAVKAIPYHHLILSGSGAKSMSANTAVAGNLSIAPTGNATASVGAGLTLNVGSLTLGGMAASPAGGTWGGTGSGAATINPTYFAATSGKLNVATPAPSLQVTNLTDGEVLRYSMVLVDGTFDGGATLTITAEPAAAAVSITRNGSRFRCLADLQAGPNTLTITDSHGTIALHLVFTPPTATDYRYKVWYVVPSDEAEAPVDPDWFTHFGLQAKLMQSWMAEDQRRAGNGRLTFYPELDASGNIDVGKLVVSQTRAQAEALNTGMFGAVWNQLPAPYQDGRHKNIVFSSVAFNALSSGDLAYVGAYGNIFPNSATEMMTRLLSTDSSGSDSLTFSSYTGVTLHETLHCLHSIWHDTSPNNIMGGGGYDISQYFTLTYSASNHTPHNESSAGTLGAQRDLAAWNRYLMSADPHVYQDTSVGLAEGAVNLTATSAFPLAVFQYYIPGAAADLRVKLAASPVTSFSKNAAAARLELGGSLINVMAVDTEGNMNYGTFSGTVPVADSYAVQGSSFTSAAPGVLANDLNPGARLLTATVATHVQHGTLVLNANGGFTYTPSPDYVGSDTFTYTLNDGIASAQQALVTLAVDATQPGIIPFTYVYEADSAPPNVPAELAAPYMLNDGLIGTGWDAKTQLYSLPPYTYPVPKIPHVTLTLAANDGLGKLSVWYARAIEAGIAEPASVTVSDEFGNSSTTTFTSQASNGVFSQDVALAGMQGSVLHLNFTSKREWVGLDEIKVVPGLPEPGFVTWAGPGGMGLAGAAAAFDADPDRDGIPNGIEFVLGGDPNPAHPGSDSCDLLPTAASDGDHLVFTFTRMHEAAYLDPVVEFSADLLGPWTTAVDPGNATIAVVNGTPADTVTVTIPQGSNTRLFARLKVVKPAVVTGGTPPSITTSLAGNTVAGGGNFTLTAAEVGTPPFTLQWYFNGIAITGATGGSYTVLGANGSHQGDYQVVVTNAQGSRTSGALHLTVTAPPSRPSTRRTPIPD
ncbi:MAG: Ig-like domain-containing protein [Verrucomicrobia bacterium]|nr:Ig-like domain-containing protein [Verrucomicrobiota bacterium]